MIAALDSAIRPSAPAARLASVRILVGLYGLIYLLIRLPYFFQVADASAAHFAPLGLASPLSAPLAPWLFRGLACATLALSVPFLLGAWHRVLAPLYAALLLFITSYGCSFGFILHTDNLFALHVAVLALTPSADALSLDARRGGSRPDSRAYGWPLRLLVYVTLATYFLAGVAKLRVAGLTFAEGDTLRLLVAMDNVRKLELGSFHSPLGALLLPHEGVFALLAGGSLALELCAPLAALGERAGRVFALAMWSFHVGVLALMAIVFAYPVSFVAFAAFFRAERFVYWVEGRVSRWTRRGVTRSTFMPGG